MARNAMDDFRGIADLEESLRLTLKHGSPFEIGRAYNNLAFVLDNAGRVERASEYILAALENAKRFGQESRWAEAAVAGNDFWRGRWGEAESRADEWLEDDAPNINEPFVRSVRARIRLARDDVTGASEDCGRVLQIFEDTRNVIVDEWVGVISACAQVGLAERRQADAIGLSDMVSGHVGTSGEAFAVVEFTLLLQEVGRSVAPIIAAADARPLFPWLQAAAAVARGEHADAADRLAELRTPPLEAAVRLRAAKHLVAESRRAEADAQLHRALAFYRSVGATRYIREGEAMLAATA
jgi:tetratricopeptide (TPR) repeat protein